MVRQQTQPAKPQQGQLGRMFVQSDRQGASPGHGSRQQTEDLLRDTGCHADQSEAERTQTAKSRAEQGRQLKEADLSNGMR